MKKRIISAVLAAAMMFSQAAAAVVHAQPEAAEPVQLYEVSGDYEYSINDDGMATITGYNGTAAELVIPDTLDGMKVIGIDYNAFSRCTELTSVVIPEGVTYIDECAFYWCTGLTSVIIPESVTSIGDGTFSYCNNLTSVTIPEGVTCIGSQTFRNCFSLTSITIPNSVTSIEEYAFSRCTSLTNVTIPDNVRNIGYTAFNGCSNLTNVDISDSVNTIENFTFEDCTSLTSIIIPYSVTSIGMGSFRLCSNLTSIIIPDSVTSMGDRAFERCSRLTDVYYTGTAEQWSAISVGSDNYDLTNATIHYNSTGPITPSRGNYITTKSITVLKNKNDMTDSSDDYEACTDAQITVDSTAYSTGSNGKAALPASGTATISVDGYYEESINLAKLSNGDKIYLEKSGMNTPVIRAVTIDGVDVRRGSATVPYDYKGAIKAEIDFNGNEESLTYISNGISTWKMTNGKTATIDFAKEFNENSGVSLIVKTKNGHTVTKSLNIRLAEFDASGEELEVSFGSTFSDIGSGVIPYFDSMSFSFNIPNFPCEIAVNGNKVSVVVGVDVAQWAYENDLRDNKSGKWKNADEKQNAFKTVGEIIKDTHKQMEKNKADSKTLAKQYKDLKKKLGNSKLSSTAKFGFDADMSVVGYIEGTIDQNGLFLSDGGIIFSAEAGVGIGGEGFIWIVPYNWEASLKGSLEAQLAIVQRELRTQQLSPEGTLKGSVSLKIEAGPGFKNFHANIAGKGAIKPGFIFSSTANAFTLDATLGAYLELQAWKLSKEFELAEADFRLYPREKSASLSEAASLYDAEGFEVIGREYLNNPQAFVANDEQASLLDVMPATKSENVIKTNTYRVSEPQMISLGDSKELLVWVDEDTDASVMNGTSLMYSLYDGAIWSEPQYVEKNGLGDFEPVLKDTGNGVYLVWSEAKEELPDTAEINELSSKLEIKYAVYDEAANAFTDIITLTDNDYTDYAPQLSAVDGEGVITWTTNTANDVFSSDSCYGVNYAYAGGTDVYSAASGIAAVDSHAAVNGAEIVYIADTDNNIETNTDNEMFIAGESGVVQITDNDTAEAAIKEFFGNVYCYNNGTLAILDNNALVDTGLVIPNDNYIVTDNGNMVCMTTGDGAVTDVYAYINDGGTWGGAVRISDLGAYITDLSGYTANNDTLRIAFNKRNVTGDFAENISTLFGASDLSTITINPSYNVTIDHVYADMDKFVDGNDAVIEVDVVNNGEKTIEELEIILTDENGTERASTVAAVSVLPGNSATAELIYPVTADFAAFNGTVSVNVPGMTEYDESDNVYEISLDYKDIALDDVSYVNTEDGYIINAAISNRGFDEVTDIEINLICDGEIVDTKSVAALPALESAGVSFENIEEGREYTVEIAQLEDESMIGNNSGFVVWDFENEYSADEIPVTEKYAGSVVVQRELTEIGEIITLVSEADVDLEKLVFYAAEYDRNGRLTGIEIIDGESVDNGLVFNVESSDAQARKLMMWDSAGEPVTEAVVK